VEPGMQYKWDSTEEDCLQELHLAFRTIARYN
jgi:hypothetical protein